MPNKKYQIIYADPPWSFNFRNRRGLSESAKNSLYDTMSATEIITLPVKTIVDDDCALFLWVMDAQIPLALKAIESWGFEYKTVAFTWIKLTSTGKFFFGGGNWTRSNPEQCLLGIRGNISRLSASVRQLIVEPRRAHSQKPDRIRQDIVNLVGDLPKIELFARQKFDGWDAWGNEVESDIKL